MITYVFAGIPVADREVSIGWYQRLAGRPPDLIPNEDEAAWQLTESGWIYLFVDPGAAGSALNTLLVDDLDAFLAAAQERGLLAGPIETIGDRVRRGTFSDPDGNRLNIGQPPA